MKRLHSAGAVFLLFLFILPVTAAAEEIERSTSFSVEGAYYLDDNKGYGVGDGGFAPISYDPEVYTGAPFSAQDLGRDLGSGWGAAEVQALLSHRIRIPLLDGAGPLMEGNNLTVRITAALTPVSLRLETQATLTPIAFLQVLAGAMVGTGWDLGLFNGMGLNDDGSGEAESSSFQGLVSETWVGGTFQFDLAALVPGEWSHVLLLVRPELHYLFYTGAEKGQAWLWEADDGENFNGLRFDATYFLGYQMPLLLDTVGILVETEQHLGYVKDLDAQNGTNWGSDHVQITVSPVFNFLLSDSAALTVLFQFRRQRLYDEPSIFANYFENRDSIGTYWDFYRVAFSYTLLL